MIIVFMQCACAWASKGWEGNHFIGCESLGVSGTKECSRVLYHGSRDISMVRMVRHRIHPF